MKRKNEKNKGSGDLMARSNPAKLPTCTKALKKSIALGMAAQAFKPSTQETGLRSMGSRPAWNSSTEQVPEQQT